MRRPRLKARGKETLLTVTLPKPARAFALPPDPFGALRGRLLGRLITPDDAEYDTARRTLYFAVDRWPLAIVQAADAEDVAEAVAFARIHGLPLAVRSGGHSLAHLSVIDDAHRRRPLDR